MSFSGDVQFTILDGAGGIFSGPANNVQAVIGYAIGGTPYQVVPTRSLATLKSMFLGGPMMEAAGLILNAGGTVLAVSTPYGTAGTINGAANATTAISGVAVSGGAAVVTYVAQTVPLISGDVVTIATVGGAVEVDGTWKITVLSATTFSVPVAVITAYTSGGTVQFTGSIATGAGTAQPYFTGGPNDELYVQVVAQTGFTLGTAGGSVLISIDAGKNYGPAIPVGTATTIALADVGGLDTGLVVHLGASGKTWAGGGIVNGVVVGDSVRCSTVAPNPSDAQIATALGAISTYLSTSGATFPLVQIVGVFAAADAIAFESGGSTNLDGLATGYTFLRALMSLRDAHPPIAWGGAGETEATWTGALNLDIGGTVAKRVCATGGHYNMPTAFPTSFAGSPAYRRPWSFALAARQVAIDPQRHAGKAGGNQGGSITQIVTSPASDPYDGFIYHDEFMNAAFDYLLPGGSGRIASSRTRKGKPGRFSSNPLLLAQPGSDFALLPRGIVMDVACTEAHDALEDFQYADLLTKSNGTLSDSAATTIGGAVRDRISSVLVSAGMITDFAVVVDQATNLIQNPRLKVTITILGVAYVLETDVTIGYAASLPATS